jgi:DnaJ-class molecular chaperone
MRDPYKTLGVKQDAGTDEIKAAWRTMAKAVHPDHNRDDPTATERFAEIGRAYETLKDPKKRSRYDQILRMAEAKNHEQTILQQRQAAREAAERAKVARANAEKVMEELARAEAQKARKAAANGTAGAAQPSGTGAHGSASSETAEDMIERIFGAQARATASAGGADAPAEKPHDAAQSDTASGGDETSDNGQATASGGIASIIALPTFGILGSLVRRITGSTPAVEKAPDMAAEATVTLDDILKGHSIAVTLSDGREVRFQATSGMGDGHVVHLKGQGMKLQGMQRGDLAITVHMAPDTRFSVRGLDIHTTLSVSIENAVLGWQTTVEGLNGAVKVTVPAWSGSDQVLRIPGEGLPDGNGAKGDLVVELRLMLWEKPDDKVTDLMRSMREGLFL